LGGPSTVLRDSGFAYVAPAAQDDKLFTRDFRTLAQEKKAVENGGPFTKMRVVYCVFFASATALSTPFWNSSIDFCASPGLSSHFDISVASAFNAPSYLAMSCWL